MWLIRFHFAFSVLCLLGFLGMKAVYRERIKRFKSHGKKKRRNYLLFFCPITNIILLAGLFYMAFCDDATAERISSKVADE